MDENYGTEAHANRALKYPYDQMNVGDFIEPPILFSQSAISCAQKYGKKSGKRFKSKKLGAGLYRITRVL